MALSCIKKSMSIPENLDSGRMVWTIGLGRLEAWTLDAWFLDAWTLGLWMPEHLDSARLDAWTLATGSLDSGNWKLGRLDSEHLDSG